MGDGADRLRAGARGTAAAKSNARKDNLISPDQVSVLLSGHTTSVQKLEDPECGQTATKSSTTARTSGVKSLRISSSSAATTLCVVMGRVDVKFSIEQRGDEDADDLAELTDDLKSELGHSGEGDVDLLFREAEPGDPVTRGAITVVGALIVRLGEAGGLRGLLTSLFEWMARTERGVEISVDGVVFKLTRATPEQQERVMQAVLARIAAGS